MSPVPIPHASAHLQQTLATKAGLTARLALNEAEIAAAQRLRFEVFYEEGRARMAEAGATTRRDEDRFDRLCDHLLIFADATGELAATCRLLPQHRLGQSDDFYTAGEFDIAPLIARHPTLRFLEIGRSCAGPDWRGKATAELLFQAIWNYVRAAAIDVMFGCASLPGTDPQALTAELACLAAAAPAPADWQVRARAAHALRLEQPGVTFDPRRTLARLPPLLKGYLRLGCYLADEAVIDHDFGTIDVLVLLPVSRINPRYFSHYGAPDSL